ncbi:MAG: hypothetical protein H6850_02715 [Alphaproteobacteria bacterium]|nr:MAG: hypothetical protein H6850_02715 [Alphaproteobacteria bacterium]
MMFNILFATEPLHTSTGEYNIVTPEEVAIIRFCHNNLPISQTKIGEKIQEKRQRENLYGSNRDYRCPQTTVSKTVNRPLKNAEEVAAHQEFSQKISRHIWDAQELGQPFKITQDVLIKEGFSLFLDGRLMFYAAENALQHFALSQRESLAPYGKIEACLNALLFGKKYDYHFHRTIYPIDLQKIFIFLGLALENQEAYFQLHKTMLEILVERNNKGCKKSNKTLIRYLTAEPGITRGYNNGIIIGHLKVWGERCFEVSEEFTTDLLEELSAAEDKENLFCHYFSTNYGKKIDLQTLRSFNPKPTPSMWESFLNCFHTPSGQ